MKDFLEKLSTYNLFNYLLPGIVFSLVATQITDYKFIQENLLLGLFYYYFIGLVISRIGSIFIEPILKNTKFLNFSDYSDFIYYSKQDEKIELFSEVNNTYRTILSLFISILLVRFYGWIFEYFNINSVYEEFIAVFLMVFLFLFSYRKQTNYITKRITTHKEKGK